MVISLRFFASLSFHGWLCIGQWLRSLLVSGAEGRENIVIVLQDIGRLDCLETLENDEYTASEDEDTEDGEVDSDDDEEEEEDDDDVQELEQSGVSPLKRADAVIQPVRVRL